jgi:competence protein ComGC
MNKSNASQRGFGFIAILLVLVVIGAVVLIGLKVMNMRSANSVVSDSTKGQPIVPVKITSKADLQTAAAALDTTNVDQVDLTQLDSALNALL